MEDGNGTRLEDELGFMVGNPSRETEYERTDQLRCVFATSCPIKLRGAYLRNAVRKWGEMI